MDRVRDLEAYITVSAIGATCYPKDGFPRWENFPLVEIAEHHGSGEALGASEDWEDDPWGAPEAPGYVTFTARGPDAHAAIEAIREVLSEPPPASKVGIAGFSFGRMFGYMLESPTPGQRYRPPGVK